MGFMKGQAAIRRTIDYLSKGNIIFRDSVKVITFQCNPPEKFPHHDGLHNFVFWHLPQLKFKNPDVHVVTFRELTPTPWIKAYLEDESEVLIDCDSRTREEIHAHLKKLLGKSEEFQSLEATKITKGIVSPDNNPANFSPKCDRECVCEIPGQIPCSRWEILPKEMRGKYKAQLRSEAMQS